MSGINRFLGVQATTNRGKVTLPIMQIATALVLLDLFNFFDGVGLVKRTLHGVLPSIFKECKFRKPVADEADEA